VSGVAVFHRSNPLDQPGLRASEEYVVTLMRFDPFRELDRLGEQVLKGAMRAMPAEAFRRGDEFFLLLDIPGVSPDDVNVTVERNVVNIEASFPSPRQEGDEGIIDERPHGRATRQFFLGENLDAANLRADYDRGVLMVTVPVAEQSKPRQIQVGTSPLRSIDVSTSTSQNAGQNAETKAPQPVNA
jgi:HSP20 family protein